VQATELEAEHGGPADEEDEELLSLEQMVEILKENDLADLDLSTLRMLVGEDSLTDGDLEQFKGFALAVQQGHFSAEVGTLFAVEAGLTPRHEPSRHHTAPMQHVHTPSAPTTSAPGLMQPCLLLLHHPRSAATFGRAPPLVDSHVCHSGHKPPCNDPSSYFYGNPTHAPAATFQGQSQAATCTWRP
jgi:hypothetical protein